MKDRFGRTFSYLRVSLTDRCNMRCVYCMPPEGVPLQPKENILSLEETARLVRLLVGMGIERVRLTGGEPLLRKGVVGFARRVMDSGIKELSMTTNGLLLDRCLKPLKDAGVSRVNISLDTLDPSRFRELTRGGRLREVLENIEAALDQGLRVKTNAVHTSDTPLNDVDSFVEYVRERPVQHRFIEFMPLCGAGWSSESYLPNSRIEQHLTRVHGALPAETDHIAQVYKIPGAEGSIGLISPMSRPFCSGCSRLRLKADGTLILCLFASTGPSLMPLLRDNASDEAIESFIARAVLAKPPGVVARGVAGHKEMRSIGG